MDEMKSSMSSLQLPSPTPPDAFPRFCSLPSEIRLTIWRFAVKIDSDPSPLYLKPYSSTSHSRRPPPKTSRINYESRQETLKHFQRLEIEYMDKPSAMANLNVHVKQKPEVVWWDDKVDVMTLDLWALTQNVEDVVSYLGLNPFIDQESGIVNSVKRLEIVAGSLELKAFRTVDSPQAKILEKALCGFVGVTEVDIKFANWGGGPGSDELFLLFVIADHFPYSMADTRPKLSVVFEYNNGDRMVLKRATLN